MAYNLQILISIQLASVVSVLNNAPRRSSSRSVRQLMKERELLIRSVVNLILAVLTRVQESDRCVGYSTGAWWLLVEFWERLAQRFMILGIPRVATAKVCSSAILQPYGACICYVRSIELDLDHNRDRSSEAKKELLIHCIVQRCDILTSLTSPLPISKHMRPFRLQITPNG